MYTLSAMAVSVMMVAGLELTSNHLVALLLEGEAGLRARVVKFRGLTDDDGAGADDEYFVDVCALRHGFPPPS